MTTVSDPSTTSGNDDRGFEVRRRRAWPWLAGAVVAILAVVGGLLVLGGGDDKTAAGGDHFGTHLKVAYLSSDSAQQALLEYIAKDVAPAHGITVEPVGIGDPNQLQAAVSDGEIAGTIYAHKPYLEESDAANGWTVDPLEPVFQWAYSLWSEKYHSLQDLPDGARIAILDDPANTAQALMLLARAGEIGLDPGVDPTVATLKDVTDNPHHIEFVPIGFGTAARTLGDFDAILTYNFEFNAAGTPESDKIWQPDAPLAFASQLGVSHPYVGEKTIKELIATFADPKVADYLRTSDDPAVKDQILPVSAS